MSDILPFLKKPAAPRLNRAGAPRFNLKAHYEHPDLGDDPRPDPMARANMAIVKWVGALLERSYPGHAWHVEAQIGQHGRNGIIKLRLNGIMPANRWYVVKLSDTLTDPGGKRTVLKGAGELLERYNLPRNKFNVDDWRMALNAMPAQARLTGRGHLAPLIA